MAPKTFHRLLLFSLFFLAHWFFGNLYEEIVLAPNQLRNSFQALVAWQGYFTVTNQLYYYLPFTQLAVVVVCVLYFKSTVPLQTRRLKIAALSGIAAIALTALIVTQLNLKLFFGNSAEHRDSLYTLSVFWLIGNAMRLVLVGTGLWQVLQVYAALQKSSEEDK